ncbi:hypothetical protein RB200_06220 [Streptomyces sp. PmtG]
MNAVPFTLRLTVRGSELDTPEHLLTTSKGTLAAEAHRISGLPAARPRRRAVHPAHQPRAQATDPVLLGLA